MCVTHTHGRNSTARCCTSGPLCTSAGHIHTYTHTFTPTHTLSHTHEHVHIRSWRQHKWRDAGLRMVLLLVLAANVIWMVRREYKTSLTHRHTEKRTFIHTHVHSMHIHTYTHRCSPASACTPATGWCRQTDIHTHAHTHIHTYTVDHGGRLRCGSRALLIITGIFA